ncbi:MAG: hypothetical protein ABR510_09650 [Trueperaceae bacterium]
MNGLLASLRFPFALRGPWAATAAVATTATTATTAAPARAARASAAFRTLARPQAPSRTHGALVAPPIARPSIAVPPTPDASDLAPRPATPVEPSVRVSEAHLVDPVGLRVVPFRPSTRWPLRRAAPRIYDPFRGFPLRSVHLADLMDGSTERR